ncbi:MAG: hypothetical protein GPJ13_01765 [Microcystis aeruginosa W11-06]|nr:hypothetical protein [Microcystis aeruginosa W11-03]NCR92543.1 hypothetical protein [Microcystis aeruginosa W11-06]
MGFLVEIPHFPISPSPISPPPHFPPHPTPHTPHPTSLIFFWTKPL